MMQGYSRNTLSHPSFSINGMIGHSSEHNSKAYLPKLRVNLRSSFSKGNIVLDPQQNTGITHHSNLKDIRSTSVRNNPRGAFNPSSYIFLLIKDSSRPQILRE